MCVCTPDGDSRFVAPIEFLIFLEQPSDTNDNSHRVTTRPSNDPIFHLGNESRFASQRYLRT